MDLTANGQVLTGTWTEETSPASYYKGAVYHGAIQLLLEPPRADAIAERWIVSARRESILLDWR